MTDHTYTSLVEASIRDRHDPSRLRDGASIVADRKRDYGDPEIIAMIADARQAIALIDQHLADVDQRIAACQASYKHGDKVRIIELPLLWNAEVEPTVGLVGRVVHPDVYPGSEQRVGRTTVKFPAGDLGFCEDEDGDDDENSIVLHLHTFSLEGAAADAVSVLPEQRVYKPNPAPDGHRWAIMYERDGQPAELGGHRCPCWEAMKEYADEYGWSVVALPMTEENTPSYLTRVVV